MDYLNACKVKLICLGFFPNTINDFDTFLQFSIDKVKNHIKNFCNINKIPDELFEVVVDSVCGEFLALMKNSKLLTNDNFDLDKAIKQISEGDISVTYSDSSTSDEDKLNNLITQLSTIDNSCLIRFRKLVW